MVDRCPSCEIQKLQSVQNAAARLITHSKKYDHITPILLILTRKCIDHTKN